jgi:Fe-S-cluster containining protein
VKLEPQNGAYGKPVRLSFPLDEAVYPWLSLLLDAYYIADRGVAEGIQREERKGRKLACAKGCSSCCRSHTTIPVYPLELVGLTWYAAEKLQGPERDKLKQQLRDHRDGDPCPFLVDGACSVHPMRPLACRHFNVFGQVCAEGEDAYYTRRQDVLTPLKKYKDEAFFTMLPFYGVEKKSERRKIVESGAMHQMAKVLQSCNWASVADKMDQHDANNRKSR